MKNDLESKISAYLRLAELCGTGDEKKKKSYMAKVETLLGHECGAENGTVPHTDRRIEELDDIRRKFYPPSTCTDCESAEAYEGYPWFEPVDYVLFFIRRNSLKKFNAKHGYIYDKYIDYVKNEYIYDDDDDIYSAYVDFVSNDGPYVYLEENEFLPLFEYLCDWTCKK